MSRSHRSTRDRRRKPWQSGRAKGFVCRRCGLDVGAEAAGTQHRNHCPVCLWSVHLDEQTGDRASRCGGGMEPIAVWVRADGEWALIHRCGSCLALKVNRIAGDDNEFALLSLGARPLVHPPFPLDRRRF